MQSGNQEPFFNLFQKSLVIFLIFLVFSSLIIFRNSFFQSTLILKKFGEFSVEPELAFTNNKPTFLEFYAEWCEICKETAPSISDIKDKYESDVNFVFLNVDNPQWESYIRKFNVNGIPQINILDSQTNLKNTFIGKNDENKLIESLENLKGNFNSKEEILIKEVSHTKNKKIYQIGPRSHG